MKQSFLFSRFCLVLFALVGLSYKGQAQTSYRLVLEQQVSNGNLVVDFKIQKTSGTDVALGNTDLTINVNTDVFNAAARAKDAAGDGLWDNGSSPSNYEDVQIVGGEEGTITVQIRRKAIVTEGNTGVIIPSTLSQIARIRIPILDCSVNGGVNWNQEGSTVEKWDSVSIRGGASFVNPDPATIPLRTLGLPTTFTVSTPLVCRNAVVTLTAPSGTGFTDYTFFKKTGSQDAVVIREPGASRTFNYTTNASTLDGDVFYATYSNGFCVYTTDEVSLTVNAPLPAPTAPTANVNLSAGLCTQNGPITNNNIISIPEIPTATSYDWVITPANAATIVAGNNTNSIEVSWNSTFTSGRVDFTVRGRNACPGGAFSAPFSVKISADKPQKPNAPSNASLSPGAFLCVNAIPSTNTWSIDTVADAARYLWKVLPAEAVTGAITSTISGGKVNAVIPWDRKFQGTSALIIVSASNGCPESPQDSVRVRLRPLPAKAAKPVGDSVIFCQKRANYTTTYKTRVIPRVSATNGYRWFVLNADGALLAGATVVAVDTSVTVTWPATYFGQAKVVVAGSFGDSCAVGASPYSFALSTIGRNLGDTGVLNVTIKPLPLRPSVPNGTRSFCISNGIPDATEYQIEPALYADSYQWEISAPGTANVSLVPNPTDSKKATLTFGSLPPAGLYTIRARGVNGCSVGPRSGALIVLVTNDPPEPANSLNPLRVCQGSDSTNFCTSAPLAAEYIWTVVPDTAGVVKATSDTTTALDGCINVHWNPNFVGNVTVTATPKNACGGSDAVSSAVIVDSRPVATAGVGGTMPLGSSFVLGGVGGAPTVTDGTGTGPYNYTWTAVGSPANVNQLIDLATNPDKPTFRPTTAGTYRFALVVSDDKSCVSVRSVVQIIVRNSFTVKTKAILEGAYSSSAGKMRDDLYTAAAPTVGGLLQRYERGGEPSPIGVEMNEGFKVPAETDNRAVDVINIDLYRNELSGTPTAGRLYAWLMQDGTIRDFETGKDPFARYYPSFVLVNKDYHIAIGHRNHLSVFGKDILTLQEGVAVPGTTLGTGFIDMTDPANVYNADASKKMGAVLLDGKAGLIGGNIFDTPDYNEVNAHDYHKMANTFLAIPVAPVYREEDVNLDGKIDSSDFDWLRKQSGKVYFSTVP